MNQDTSNPFEGTVIDLVHQPKQLRNRHRIGSFGRISFFGSTLVAILALVVLMLSIIDKTAGYLAVVNKVDPTTLSETPLDQLTHDELASILVGNLTQNRINTIEREKPLAERSKADLYQLIEERVIQPSVEKSWTLSESIFQSKEVFATAAADYPDAQVEFRFWLTGSFLTNTMSSKPELAGVRTALLGSLYMIAVTILVAFPIGVGAAIYLEEYAQTNRINRIIQTNIDNLAGVPSIVYGILGLAIFVRAFNTITSGSIFGLGDQNGRTILSAALTLALLILPILIINAQEAIRAVPNSLRQASFGLGATRWQTIWHHVLPAALPGILTGTILAISRAIGETAPLILVGASTFITSDPDGLFSKFTALPIQIYNWTTRPQDEFRFIAAAAILVLMISLLSMNAVAILLRNRFTRR